MLDSLPGGIDSLRQLVNDFQGMYGTVKMGQTALCLKIQIYCTDAGVKVLLPYLPWDQGTRNSGQSDVVSMVDYIIASDSDGKWGRCPYRPVVVKNHMTP